MQMILDNLQVHQYQYPEKSTVRELVSNALDAVKEKQIAVAILTGKSKEEDFYLRREEAVYKDSNFNHDYYNIRYFDLSEEAKNVIIHYYENSLGRDQVTITDHGVGLGGKRLKGYFQLGYSSKRNTKFALGKFGIGAKAALSTGIDCYYVETAHNGLLTKFNVYSHKVTSLVPRLNLDKGTENVLLEFDGEEVYAEPYDGFNYTRISIEVKKHKRGAYMDAVKSQLMYFPNVTFLVTNEAGDTITHNIKAPIVFENDKLLVAKHTQYNRPHILINNVNYGLIDFKELELEDKVGNVGIKLAAEDVTVNPSRESVIWNDHTRSAVIRAFQEAQSAATELLKDKLKETDYFRWHKAMAGIKGFMYAAGDDETDALKVLSKIIDLEQLDMEYLPEPNIRSGFKSLWGIEYHEYMLVETKEKKNGKNYLKRKLERNDYTSIYDSMFNEGSVILWTDISNASYLRTLRYLFTQGIKQIYLFHKNPTGLSNWTKGLGPEDDVKDFPLYCDDQSYKRLAAQLIDPKGKMKEGEVRDMYHTQRKIISQMQQKVWNYLTASSLIRRLESIVVPEDFKFNPNQQEEEEIIEESLMEDNKSVGMTNAERRKLEQRIHVKTPSFEPWNDREFLWRSYNPRIADMHKWKGVTYYCTGLDQSQLQVAAALSVGNAIAERAGTKGFDPQKPTHLPHLRDNHQPYTGIEALEDVNFFRKEYLGSGHSNTSLFYFSALQEAEWTEMEEVCRPGLRLISVAQDVVKKLPDHFKHISQFFLDFKDKHITMASQLSNWFMATRAKAVVEAAHYAGNNRFPYSRIKLLHGRLRAFSEQYIKLNISSYMNYIASGDKDRYKDGEDVLVDVKQFLGKVLEFQQFVHLHREDPTLVAQSASHYFGNDQIKGTDAFDLERLNEIEELEEFHKQAGPIAMYMDWGKIPEEGVDMFRQLSQIRGIDPWVFEPTYKQPVTPEDNNQ